MSHFMPENELFVYLGILLESTWFSSLLLTNYHQSIQQLGLYFRECDFVLTLDLQQGHL